MILIKTAVVDPKDCKAIFSIPTGQRTNLTTRELTLTLPESNTTIHKEEPVTYNATATDVFMDLNGVVNRLFVDVDVDVDFFGRGLKHIWLTDGPLRMA